jgi:hypothetical protein
VPTATETAALATAVGAALTGLAQVLTALRSSGQREAAGAAAGAPDGSGLTQGQLAHAEEAARLATWSLRLGACAWLLAAGSVIIVGATSVALDSAPLRALEWGSITLAALAVGSGALSLYQSVVSGAGPARPLRAAAGLAVSLGALAALVVAGT